MDPLQSMGAVRMRVQTADKNITVIHTTPVHRLKSCEVKSCVYKKTNPWLRHFKLNKYESSIHNIAFSSEKSNMHRFVCMQKKKSKTALNKYVGGLWREKTTGDGFFDWRKHYYGLWIFHSILAKSSKPWWCICLYVFDVLVTQDVNRWTGVVWINGLLWCFHQLSFWRHPFTAEDTIRMW